MPEETPPTAKMGVVETSESSPAKKQTLGKMALAKITMLDGTVLDVHIEVYYLLNFYQIIGNKYLRVYCSEKRKGKSS